MAKRDEILRRLAALSDDELEKLATPPTAPASTTTPATTPTTAAPATTETAPAASAPVPATPSPAPAPAADPAALAAAATAILGASGIDIAALNAMLAGEKAKNDQIRETLITALSSRTPELTREMLSVQPTPTLEMMARAAGILSASGTVALGLPAGTVVDYSGLGLPVQPAALNSSGKKYEAPDPFGLRKKESAAN